MRRFLTKLAVFTTLLLAIIAAGVMLPATPRAAGSMLFAVLGKEQRLRQTKPPRIIFVGGSNLSFGLDSEAIEKAVGLTVINTGLHAGLGLRYMLESVIPFVGSGDVVVLAVEYSLFYQNFDYASEDLLRVVFDVSPRHATYLSPRQLVKLMPFVPRYAFTKFHPWEYLWYSENDVHSKDSFNEHGDAVSHWQMDRRHFMPYGAISGEYNPEVLESILRAREEIERRGGVLLVTYPCLQDASFDVSAAQIKKVADEYRSHGLQVLGTPERYRMPDELTFDTPYHLQKAGVDLRTRRFIEDYSRFGSQ